MERILVSVIIPTLDRQEITLNTVKIFEHQSLNRFELIVLDQSSVINTNLERYESNKFYYVYKNIEEKGLPNARNVAAKIARGEILLFVDDDILPDIDLIIDFITEFNNQYHEKIIIGGRVEEKAPNMMCNDPQIIGGYITYYGKPIKNFSATTSGYCDWVVGCNFAIRKKFFLEVSGFDKNFIGNAMFEDCDFCFTVKENGGQVYYSPKPFVEHLRAVTGGTRQINKSKGMYYRAHNTVYFLRKHEFKLRLISTFFYLNAVAIKDLILRRHGISAIFWSWMGYFKGFTTK